MFLVNDDIEEDKCPFNRPYFDGIGERKMSLVFRKNNK